MNTISTENLTKATEISKQLDVLQTELTEKLAEKARLETERNNLLGVTPGKVRNLSPEARQRISDAQKARHAKNREAQAATAPVPVAA